MNNHTVRNESIFSTGENNSNHTENKYVLLNTLTVVFLTLK